MWCGGVSVAMVCLCLFIVLARLSHMPEYFTVAILDQGTHWAVADMQAFDVA